jgi:DNA-binding XRE family transcriptional regulator
MNALSMTEAEARRVGAVFRMTRTTIGYTQREFAARVGISASQVSRIERGERPLYSFEPLYWRLINFYGSALILGGAS